MKVFLKERIKDYIKYVNTILFSKGKLFSINKMAHSEFFTLIFILITFICNIFWFDLTNSYILSLIIVIFLASFKQIIIDKYVLDLKPDPKEFIMSIKFSFLITLGAYFL